jgi:hypothetical protein
VLTSETQKELINSEVSKLQLMDQMQPTICFRVAHWLIIISTNLNGWEKEKLKEYYFMTGEKYIKFEFYVHK